MMMKNEIINGLIQTYGLEFFAVDHCNLKCSGCSQCSPFLKKHFADISIFEKNLESLSKYLRPNKITILGGEPLLHPEIDSIVSIARNSKMFNKIHITTNGLNLLKMSSAFWLGVDVVRISKYPANADFINQNLEKFINVSETNKVELQIREMNSFNRIILTEENTNEKLVNEIYDRCIYKYYCHTLSEGKIFRCSPVVNLKKYHEAIKNTSTSDFQDYLEIDDSTNFKTTLFNYLKADTPLSGCKFCLGSSGKSFPNTQLTKAELLNPEKYFLSKENYVSHE
jgi:ABC-2 type transport system ATP-binding protein